MRRSGKSVLHSRWRIGWSAVQDSQGKAESGHIHVAIDGDRRAETGAGSAVADVAKRAQGRAAWYGAVRGRLLGKIAATHPDTYKGNRTTAVTKKKEPA